MRLGKENKKVGVRINVQLTQDMIAIDWLLYKEGNDF
jgi:hypothetical protein